MASGRAHARVAGALLIPLGLAGAWVGLRLSAPAGAGIMTGALAGYVVTPDIDIVGMTYEERRILNVSPTLGTFWRWAWIGYGILMPHRGVSHWPVIGTITRMAYVAFLAAVAACIALGLGLLPDTVDAADLWAHARAIVVNHRHFFVGLAGAWAVQDIGHLVLDCWRQAPVLVLIAAAICVWVYQVIAI